MPTLHDLIPAALARLASTAPEPTAQRKADARATRASAGRRRLDSKLLTGALAAGLVTAVAYPSIVAFDPWGEDVIGTPGEFRFPPGTETRGSYMPLDFESWCGQPMPEPLTSQDGFTLTTNVRTDGAGTPEWFAAVDYTGPDRDVHLDDSVGLIARDGIVVGVQYNTQGQNLEPLHFRDGASTSAGFSAGGYAGVSWCSIDWMDPDPADLAVAAGDYESVWVMQAHMTARDQALSALRDAGYSLAASTLGTYPDDFPREQRPTFTWSPGSVDCIRATVTSGYGWETPLQCERTLPDFVTLEPETGAYIVHFDPDEAGPPLDVRLVSEPVDFQLKHDLTLAELGFTGSYEEPTPAPPGCGAPSEPYQWSGSANQGLDTGAAPSLLAGERARLILDFQPTMGDTDATVRLPEGERVWIAPGYGASFDVSTDVEFRAYATVHFSSPVVELHRASGFPDLEMWFTDVTLCEGSAPGDPFLDSGNTWFYVPAETEVAWESGRVETVSEMVIREDALWY